MALKRLKEIVKDCLNKVYIIDNSPNFESAYDELSKIHNLIKGDNEISKYIGEKESVLIFLSHLYDYTFKNLNPSTPQTGKLIEVFSKEQIDSLSEEITNFYSSIPRDYTIYFPLCKFTDREINSIQLSNSIFLEVFKKGELLPFTISNQSNHNQSLDSDWLFLKFKEKGYCINDLSNTTVRKAYSKFKIFLQQGISKEILTQNESENNGLAFFLSQGSTHLISKILMTCIDDQLTEKVTSIALPLEFCRFVERLELNWDKLDHVSEYTSNKYENKFKNFFAQTLLLIETELTEARNIKAAIEWYFDCLIHENQTVAFILICIGLEALFDQPKESITEMISERYAFHVGKSITQRNELKKNVRELYRLRSQFVHGKKLTLSESDVIHLDRGINLLSYAINKEIRQLELS